MEIEGPKPDLEKRGGLVRGLNVEVMRRRRVEGGSNGLNVEVTG